MAVSTTPHPAHNQTQTKRNDRHSTALAQALRAGSPSQLDFGKIRSIMEKDVLTRWSRVTVLGSDTGSEKVRAASIEWQILIESSEHPPSLVPPCVSDPPSPLPFGQTDGGTLPAAQRDDGKFDEGGGRSARRHGQSGVRGRWGRCVSCQGI